MVIRLLGWALPQLCHGFATLLCLFAGQEARVPISKVILMTARIGARIKISQKEDC